MVQLAHLVLWDRFLLLVQSDQENQGCHPVLGIPFFLSRLVTL
jgi:hypothetical protein